MILVLLLGLAIHPVPAAAADKIDLFGTMLAFQSSHGFGGQKKLEKLINKSWLTLRDSSSFADFLSRFEDTTTVNANLVAATNFSSNRDVVGAFAWNVVVPEPGEYDWTLTDATLEAAGKAEVTISAVIQPFSSWGSSQQLDQDLCDSIDFTYFDYYTGTPARWDAYEKFVGKLVERYDGDGIDDMPGLTTRVSAWEVGNEVEGNCGGNLSKPQRYVKLLRRSYRAIKEADPTALVLNAGALEIIDQNGLVLNETKDFWREFFDLEGERYLDVFNIHYNSERDGALEDMVSWQKHLKFFTQLMPNDLPIWVTEFGTLSGTNDETDVTQSRKFQASWYLRYIVMGMSYGVERYYLDLSGPDDSKVTSAALYASGGEARLYLTTLQTLAAVVDGYTSVTKLEAGQYQFTLEQGTAYVLWSGDLPAALDSDASVTVYDLTGTSAVLAGNDITYSKKNPVLVYSE